MHLPFAVVNRGIPDKGRKDCGNHEWYNSDDIVDRCYHCKAGTRPHVPRA
jgi:hypothetical protein